jgi:hypothetical protein
MKNQNENITVRLVRNSDDRFEGLAIYSNGSWSSPQGGWLNATAGLWERIGINIINLSSDNGAKLVQLRGLEFEKVPVGMKGDFLTLKESEPEPGRWEIISVFP